MTCIEGSRSIISQIMALLREIDREAYARPLDLYNGSTLGQHFRHICDFYYCLLRGLPNRLIDYADRERRPEVELDPGHALMAFQHILYALDTMEEHQPLQVRGDFSTAPEHQRPLLASTVGRELMFAHDHAVHHLAIIRMGLQSVFPEVALEENLGVAPSTVKYQSKAGSPKPEVGN